MLRVSRELASSRVRDARGSRRRRGSPAIAADRVEVVDRVVEHFEPRRALRGTSRAATAARSTMRTSMSTSSPSAAAIEQIAQRQHVRAEAQLEVHRRGEPPLAAAARESRAPPARSSPIGFWISTGSAARQPAQDAENLVAGHGEVEHRVRATAAASASVEKTPGRANCARRLARRVRSDVEEAGDREAEAPIRRQVRRADDRAGADDDDGPRTRRQRPGLPQVRHRRAVRTCPARRRGRCRSGGRPAPSAPTIRRAARPAPVPAATSSAASHSATRASTPRAPRTRVAIVAAVAQLDDHHQAAAEQVDVHLLHADAAQARDALPARRGGDARDTRR